VAVCEWFADSHKVSSISRKKGIVFDMSDRQYNEMEEIRRGLEAYLNQEVLGQEEQEEQEETEPEVQERSREPQLYDLEDWDSPEFEEERGRRAAGRSGEREKAGQNGRKMNSDRRDGKPNTNSRERDYDRRDRNQNDRTAGSGRKKRRKKKSRLKKVLFALILVVALLAAGLYSLVGIVYNKLEFEEISSVADLPMKEDGVVNILLIGNDSRENGEDGRSDAMILLSISSRTKTIYLTSLLRDMYVEIPGHDGNRLNAAYSFGGAELLMETVEKNFDITVNRCVQVNFEAFANLVDAVGGVELELTSEEVEYVNGYLVEYNMLLDRPQGTDNLDTSVSGLIHLNGPQALAYCRNRYLGTDFGRTERQRKVMTAVLKKLPVSLMTNGSEVIDGLMPNLTTNLSQGECFRLSLMAGKLLTYEIVSDSIPQPGTYKDATIRKMAVLEVDFDANKKYLKEKIYGE
jgi:LCP family protein required for cell wall assembly